MGIAFASVVAASVASGSFVACVDPKGDYEEYVDRTSDVRGVSPDTGTADVPVIEAGDANADVSGTFFTSCLPGLFKDDPSKSFLFYVEAKVSGGKIDLVVYPMKETATTFSKSETVGTPHQALGVPIVDGAWNAVVGDAKIPGNSQRIGESEIVLADLAYQGRTLNEDRLCSELQGRATSPLTIEFNEPGDICIYQRMKEGDPLPTGTDPTGTTFTGFSGPEYHCP